MESVEQPGEMRAGAMVEKRVGAMGMTLGASLEISFPLAGAAEMTAATPPEVGAGGVAAGKRRGVAHSGSTD